MRELGIDNLENNLAMKKYVFSYIYNAKNIEKKKD